MRSGHWSQLARVFISKYRAFIVLSCLNPARPDTRYPISAEKWHVGYVPKQCLAAEKYTSNQGPVQVSAAAAAPAVKEAGLNIRPIR